MEHSISVIIPVYNVEPYIRQCLDSVVNQTYKNLEIIIVDDGSPDNCPAICDEYANWDDRITVIHKKNGGVCAARNDGIRVATGEWIAFVDPDDWCELDYYECAVGHIKDFSVDVVCMGGYFKDDENASIKFYHFNKDFYFDDEKDMEILQAMTLAPYYRECVPMAATWDLLYKRDFILNQNLQFDSTMKIHDDLWFNLHVFSKSKKVEGHCAVGYHYRTVTSSIVNRFNPARSNINYEFISRTCEYLKSNENNELSQLMRRAINYRCFVLIFSACQCYYFHPNNPNSLKITVKEINQMIHWPYYHDAIWSKYNTGLSKKRVLVKYMLRLPGGSICFGNLCWLRKKNS